MALSSFSDPIYKRISTETHNFVLRAIFDLDQDGFPDLIGENVADSTVQVQVWGKATATSVSEEDLIVAGFQLQQNYPNPFNPSTVSIFKQDETTIP